MTTDVFSDVSGRPTGRFVGAYVVGLGGEPEAVSVTPANTPAAEVACTLAALYEALRRGCPRVVLHSDVKDIGRLMRRARKGPLALLRHVCDLHGAVVLDDARKYPEYRRCHLFARIQAGIYGTRHPARLGALRVFDWKAEPLPAPPDTCVGG